MDRVHFGEGLARTRLTEARTLLDQGHWSGAYYLAGYAVELSLKARANRRIAQDLPPMLENSVLPDPQFKRKFGSLYTHDLSKLRDYPWVTVTFATDAGIERAWKEVTRWNEHARYGTFPKDEAIVLVEAVETIVNYIQGLPQ